MWDTTVLHVQLGRHEEQIGETCRFSLGQNPDMVVIDFHHYS